MQALSENEEKFAKNGLFFLGGIVILWLMHGLFYLVAGDYINWLWWVAIVQLFYGLPVVSFLLLFGIIGRRTPLVMVALGILCAMMFSLLIWPSICGSGAGLTYSNDKGLELKPRRTIN